MGTLRLLASLALVLSACASTDSPTEPAQPGPTEVANPTPTASAPVASTPAPAATVVGVEGQLFPDVLAAVATQASNGSWSFDVTLSSPYDTPQRYADAWRVLDEAGNELGVRVLVHDHASEQPFTRSLGGVEIPDEVQAVTIEGRDIESGWGGATVQVNLR